MEELIWGIFGEEGTGKDEFVANLWTDKCVFQAQSSFLKASGLLFKPDYCQELKKEKKSKNFTGAWTIN